MLRIPLPNAPAGSVMEGMGQANALSAQNLDNRIKQLQNQYYGPNIQSEIDYRKSQTQGQNIQNQFMPDKLRLANAFAQLQNQYYPQDIQSQIALRGAQSRLGGAQANKINYMLQHPGLMGNDQSKMIQSLMDMGIINRDSIGAQQVPNGNMQSIPMNAAQPQQQSQTPLDIGNPLTNAALQSDVQAAPISAQNPMQAPFPGNIAPFKTGNTLLDSVLNKPYASMAYQQKMAQGFNWVHLPVETKNQLIAHGYGMGIDPLKMMDYVNQGMSLPQIAQKEGLDPNNLPPPIYSPTTATKTRVQQVQQVGAELDYLSSASTPLIRQYADTFAGISPERITDMLSNNPEAQKRFGQYIGALSIQTGLANGRVLLEGGRPGVEVMRMVKDSALKGIDQHSPIRMTKTAYQTAQDTIDNILQKGAKIRTTTGMNPMSEIGKSKDKSEKDENKTPKKWVYNSSTGKLESNEAEEGSSKRWIYNPNTKKLEKK